MNTLLNNINLILVAKRKASLQPEKTRGYQFLFAVKFFNFYPYWGRANMGHLGALDTVFELRNWQHWIHRQILRSNVGQTFLLAQGLNFHCLAFSLSLGVNKGYLGGLDKVFKIRNRHHRIRRQILRIDEGLTFILAQSWKFSFLGPN